MEQAPTYEVLPGLPPYGPRAVAFSATGQGTHQEGFVVRFNCSDGKSWAGNFQLGGSTFSTVVPHPDGRRVVVIAGGQAYIVDPADSTYREYISWCYDRVIPTPNLLILGSPIDFEAIGPVGMRWRTRRISFDGIYDVHLSPDARTLLGEAWSPMTDELVASQVNLEDGTVKGGCFGA